MEIKHLNKENLDFFSLVSSGLLYLIVGIFFIVKKSALIFAVKGLLSVLTILFIVAGLLQLLGLSLLTNKKLTRLSRFFAFILNISLSILIYHRPEYIVSILPLSFGIYAFSSGIIRLLVYIQYKKNNVRGRIFVLSTSITLSFLGLLIINNPLIYLIPISNIIGVFFILYGLTFIVDGLVEGLSVESKNSFKRRIRINLPVFMVVMIPHRVLKGINKAFETDSFNPEDLVAHKENTEADLEVLIHVGEKGTTAFGHVDIYFEGRIMTYGSYDESTYKLKGLISDAVLMEIDSKEKYIDFSQNYFNKTLFGFGLKLNEEQKARVRQKIKEIHDNLYPWKPEIQVAEELGSKDNQEFRDYASIVYDNLKARFYKFKKGPFKTYFGMNTNCVLLADTIVGQAGIDIVKIQGLISPGAYFEYLNREFFRKNSLVVSRIIYHKGDP